MVSTELRSKAIELVLEKKKTRQEVADLFGVDRKTIYLWIRIYKIEGRKGPIKKHERLKGRKLQSESFRNFVDQNSGMTIKQMSIALKVGISAVKGALRRIGYTRKKNSFYIESEKSRNEKNLQNS